MRPLAFDLQGHRGARGLRPENTLPSFEAALDAGVTSIETDLHLTRDGVPVLCHDPLVDVPVFSPAHPQAGAPAPLPGPLLPIARLTLAELRVIRVAGNPAPAKFVRQSPEPTPVAQAFARERGIDPYVVPTLADLFHFVAAYAGELGRQAGKTDAQRRQASRVGFDLELKRVAFHPEAIGDHFDGENPGLLELRTVEEVHAAGVLARTSVRSFDHRSVRAVLRLEPALTGGVLLAHTACVDPVAVAESAGARVFCPSYESVDAGVVRRLQRAGIRVLPWTVNEESAWAKLVEMGVDGITTDDPDLLADWLERRRDPGAEAEG